MPTKLYRYRQSEPLDLSLEERVAVENLAARSNGAGLVRIQVGKGDRKSVV
jgi:hypothetical protein